MICGVFCRPNHPEGYGQCRGPIQSGASGYHQAAAHGYVTVIVKAQTYLELWAAQEILKKGYHWPGRQDNWYSGPMEMVAVLEGTTRVNDHYGRPTADEDEIAIAVGDNRAFAYVKASYLLGKQSTIV